MLTLEEMNQAMSQVKDNLVVQGQLLHGLGTNLDRLEADMAASRRDFDERIIALVQRADEDREQLRIMQSAMARLFEHMDRFIRGLESDGHGKGQP